MTSWEQKAIIQSREGLGPKDTRKGANRRPDASVATKHGETQSGGSNHGRHAGSGARSHDPANQHLAEDTPEQLHIEDRHDAYGALRSVLHLLRDRLTPEQAVHLGAQSRFSFEGSTTTAGALRESQLTNGNRRS